MTELYISTILSGILNGVIYALIAVGLSVIFGVMRLVNFAHGEFVVVGMYCGYWGFQLLGLSPVLATPAVALAMFFVGYALQRSYINRFTTQPHHVQFIVFIGFALVITGLNVMLFGPSPRGIFSDTSFATYDALGFSFDATRVQAALGAILLLALLTAFLRWSRTGRSLRAAADNRTGAEVIGIPIPHVFAVAAGIGLASAGAAGSLIAPMFETQPFLAPEFTMLAFIIVIVGGLGSLPGAIVGGILIGVVEGIAALMLNPSMKSLYSYALLLLVLLIKPSGLFGSKGERV